MDGTGTGTGTGSGAATGRPLVAVVGSVNLDLVATAARLPAPGETLIGTGYGEHAGGKGANQAVAAAAVGAAELVAAFGADPAAGLVRSVLARAGVGTAASVVVGGPSGRAFVSVAGSGENAIIVVPGANLGLTAGMVAAALDALAPNVVLAQLEIPAEAVLEAFRWTQRSGARWLLNPSPVREVAGDVLAGADPLIVNEHEARAVLAQLAVGAGADLDGSDLPALTAELAARVTSVVVTAGPAGAWLGRRGDPVVHVAAPQVTAVDTTGAGDVFAGTVAAHLASGATLSAAATAASVAAAEAVRRARRDR